MSIDSEARSQVAVGWRRLTVGLSGSAARRLRELAIPAALLALVVFFSIVTDEFLSVTNILKVVNDAAVVGTLALGMTFVLILAGIDLSVGAVVTLTTVLLGVLLVDIEAPIALAIGLALLAGAGVGLANGLIIVKMEVPPLITTLGTLSILAGINSYITEGAITSLGRFDAVLYIGQGYVGEVPFPAILLMALALTCHILLTRTTFGARIRAIGGNRQASAAMGLDVAGYTVAVYAISALLASVGGLIVAGRLAASSPQAGLGLELQAIAAAVLGGTSLFGGRGSIVGTLAGTLILSVLFNGLILLGVPFLYQLVVTGLVVLTAVAFNEAVRRPT